MFGQSYIAVIANKNRILLLDFKTIFFRFPLHFNIRELTFSGAYLWVSFQGRSYYIIRRVVQNSKLYLIIDCYPTFFFVSRGNELIMKTWRNWSERTSRRETSSVPSRLVLLELARSIADHWLDARSLAQVFREGLLAVLMK